MEEQILRTFVNKDSLGEKHKIKAEYPTWTKNGDPTFLLQGGLVAYFTQPVYVKEIDMLK